MKNSIPEDIKIIHNIIKNTNNEQVNINDFVNHINMTKNSNKQKIFELGLLHDTY
jgi:hypothetical protein